jgi:hypothetical protein
MGKGWGKSVITGLGRLDGWPVAILASDPYYYAGAWTSDACRKAIRLIDLAQTFALPVVHFVDIPGFLIGKEAEVSGVMRYGTQALAAIRQCSVPFCSIIVRKAFGMAALANATVRRHSCASPGRRRAGARYDRRRVDAAYRAVIEAAPDRRRSGRDQASLEAVQSPIRTAEAFGVERSSPARRARTCVAS